MLILRSYGAAVCGMVLVFTLGSTGCATRKFVRNTVAPIGTRTSDLEKKTAGHESQLEGLDRRVAAANERAVGADGLAQDAAASAAKAQQSANEAGGAAKDAQSLAQKGLDTTNVVERKLSARIEDMDNFELVSTESVLFAFNSSELTAEAKAQLDSQVSKVGSMKHFVLQLEGFTDMTGANSYNVELSRRRADAVARYLVTSGKVPLFRIHLVGLGSANPVAENETRKGRQENRRVEVRLFSAGGAAQGTSETARRNPTDQ